MKGFTNKKSFKVLLIVVVVLLVIIIFTTAAGGSFLASILGFMTTPTQSISTDITDNVKEYLNLDSMTTEELKQRLQELSNYANSLTEQVVDYEKIKRENEQLKQQLQIEEDSGELELEMIGAAVVSRDANDVFYGFSIDKGYLNGVSKDDVVITEEGLVGIVSEVYATTSIIKTIYSEDVRVSVIAQQYDETGVLNSDIMTADSGLVRMDFLSNTTEITQYAIITTSGASPTYPPGITVGYVISVDQSNTDVSKYAMIQPKVDIKNVRNVTVITGFPGKDEMPEDTTGSEASNNQDPEAGS